jgi:hypothetical protein
MSAATLRVWFCVLLAPGPCRACLHLQLKDNRRHCCCPFTAGERTPTLFSVVLFTVDQHAVKCFHHVRAIFLCCQHKVSIWPAGTCYANHTVAADIDVAAAGSYV